MHGSVVSKDIVKLDLDEIALYIAILLLVYIIKLVFDYITGWMRENKRRQQIIGAFCGELDYILEGTAQLLAQFTSVLDDGTLENKINSDSEYAPYLILPGNARFVRENYMKDSIFLCASTISMLNKTYGGISTIDAQFQELKDEEFKKQPPGRKIQFFRMMVNDMGRCVANIERSLDKLKEELRFLRKPIYEQIWRQKLDILGFGQDDRDI